MNNDLAQKAISFALKGDWENAINCNKEIITNSPDDVDALNRLARAYAESGSTSKALEYTKKVLTIDPFNSIAVKCKDKWKNIKNAKPIATSNSIQQSFIEEPGKTKIVSLINLGDANVLARLDSGDEVFLNFSAHRVSLLTEDGKHIGRLPDDLASRLKELTKYGNEYQVHVKHADAKEVRVFIRETKRSTQLKDVPSFSTEKIEYISFTPPELVHTKDDIVKEVVVDEE